MTDFWLLRAKAAALEAQRHQMVQQGGYMVTLPQQLLYAISVVRPLQDACDVTSSDLDSAHL